jgi:hypothetical protein
VIFITLWETWKGRINHGFLLLIFVFPFLFMVGWAQDQDHGLFIGIWAHARRTQELEYIPIKPVGKGFTVNKDQLHHGVVTTRCEADPINFVKSIETKIVKLKWEMDNIFILYHDFSLQFFLRELGLLLVLGGYPIWSVRTIGSGFG